MTVVMSERMYGNVHYTELTMPVVLVQVSLSSEFFRVFACGGHTPGYYPNTAFNLLSLSIK